MSFVENLNLFNPFFKNGLDLLHLHSDFRDNFEFNSNS